MTLAVTGGRVLGPAGEVDRADLLVEDGEIAAVATPGTVDADDELDASGAVVTPGLVNAHTHVAMTLLRGYADDKPLDRWLREDVWPAEAAMTAEDVRAGAELGLVEMVRAGVTGFADMYFHVEAVADAVERVGLRARLAHGVVTVGKDDADAAADVEESLAVADRLRGRADGRVRTAVAPHSLTTVDAESMERLVAGARDLGVPLHYHLSETEDEVDPVVADRGRRPVAYADDLGALGPTDFVAHAVHVDDDELDVLADRGTGVVHCPAANTKLASGAAPVPAMRERSIPVAVGTDGPASNNDLDPFDELRDAALLAKHAAGDASVLPAPAAVAMATDRAAEVVGLPGGRIEAGAPADLAVVDFEAPHLTPAHDVLSNLAYAARGSDVRHTVCDGQVLLCEGELQTVDEDRVLDRASEAARELAGRI